MNLKNLPNEAGIPLSEFYRVNERFRLTLRPYQGDFIFRLDRWIERGPEGLWTFHASEGLSLRPSQAGNLMTGIQLGLEIIENDAWSTVHSRVVRG